MIDYREILRLYSLGYSQRQIEAITHFSRHTISFVLDAANETGICWPLDDSITNQTLHDIFYPDRAVDIKEMVSCYNAGISAYAIAKDHGIDTHKVVKILITAGVYTSEKYDLVRSFREMGFTDEEIMKAAKINEKSLYYYTPYTRGRYRLKEE